MAPSCASPAQAIPNPTSSIGKVALQCPSSATAPSAKYIHSFSSFSKRWRCDQHYRWRRWRWIKTETENWLFGSFFRSRRERNSHSSTAIHSNLCKLTTCGPDTHSNDCHARSRGVEVQAGVGSQIGCLRLTTNSLVVSLKRRNHQSSANGHSDEAIFDPHPPHPHQEATVLGSRYHR